MLQKENTQDPESQSEVSKEGANRRTCRPTANSREGQATFPNVSGLELCGSSDHPEVAEPPGCVKQVTRLNWERGKATSHICHPTDKERCTSPSQVPEVLVLLHLAKRGAVRERHKTSAPPRKSNNQGQEIPKQHPQRTARKLKGNGTKKKKEKKIACERK